MCQNLNVSESIYKNLNHSAYLSHKLLVLSQLIDAQYLKVVNHLFQSQNHSTRILDMTIEQAFGIALRKLRQEKGLSQEALAASSGFHRTYISLLERGVKSPSLTTLDRLSQALGISLSQFVNSIEAATNNKKRAQ